MTTHDAMHLLRSRQITPDFVYVDADHSYEGCRSDIEDAYQFGRKTLIAGDDWNWGEDLPVRRAVVDCARSHHMIAVSSDNFWQLHYGDDLQRLAVTFGISRNECVDEIAEKDRRTASAERELAAVTSSASYAAGRLLARMSRRFLPWGSMRRRWAITLLRRLSSCDPTTERRS